MLCYSTHVLCYTVLAMHALCYAVLAMLCCAVLHAVRCVGHANYLLLVLANACHSLLLGAAACCCTPRVPAQCPRHPSAAAPLLMPVLPAHSPPAAACCSRTIGRMDSSIGAEPAPAPANPTPWATERYDKSDATRLRSLRAAFREEVLGSAAAALALERAHAEEAARVASQAADDLLDFTDPDQVRSMQYTRVAFEFVCCACASPLFRRLARVRGRPPELRVRLSRHTLARMRAPLHAPRSDVVPCDRHMVCSARPLAHLACSGRSHRFKV
jgi:hypothetical protein